MFHKKYNNNKSKSKSKSRSKDKNKKFNPFQYLNSLIELHEHSYDTGKKKINNKRDLSSALTLATPAL